MAIYVKKGEESTIETEKIFFKLEDKKALERLVDSLDYVPYLYVKKINDPTTPSVVGTSIDPTDVKYVKLFNNKFLPEIELYCTDSKGVLFNDFYPFDHDTLLCIFVKSNSEIPHPIRMDFRISEYETISNAGKLKYIIKGILNVDELHYTKYESFEGTSYDVLKDIALHKLGLGWSTNTTSSDDKMVWINPANTYLNFIKDITKNSYISEKSFIWTFIDFYYNLNYVNVQTEMDEFNKDEESSIKDTLFIKDDEERNVKQYLTNNQAFDMTNKYISKFNLVNQSFKVNLEKYYQNVITWYDKTENTVFKKVLEILENDEQKIEDSKLKQLNDKDSEIFTQNYDGEFLNKIDTEDNVHKKYSYAKSLNKFNLLSMKKMQLVITLNRINFNIKRFQNILIYIYNKSPMLDKNVNDDPLQNINKRLSGYWYVTGINYSYRRSGGQEQEITLMRRDLSIDFGDGSALKEDLRKMTAK